MPGSEAAEDVSKALPRWDLSPIYPALSSPEYEADKERLRELASELERHLDAASRSGDLGSWLAEALRLEDEAGRLGETLGAYAYATYSTDTRDQAAMAQLNAVEALCLPLKRAIVLFRDALASRKGEVLALVEGPSSDPRLAPFAFHIREQLFWQSKQMKGELEDLASDLQRSGGDAWMRLQEMATSSASVAWDEGPAGLSGGRKTLVELRGLAHDADRSVREKAYRRELEACKSIEVPVAAALNGVKGWAVSLNARRGWDAAIDKSIAQARITRATLGALMEAMEGSLPSWRRYLKAKAKFIGTRDCAFYDLFAPLPSGAADGKQREYGFSDARDFIVEKFSSFDPAMGDFASRAFEGRWIDAEPRPGKVGGGYCVPFPGAKASRILVNFDGSFSAITTVAHELGHAWHGHQVMGLPYAYMEYPMTLAETASIFAETLVFESALKGAEPCEKAGILELHLQDACQVIVDILSRFYFEGAVFERRAAGELSPDELCELMIGAQKRSYGDGLDPELLHPYMWLVKGHYYSPDLGFYNFPYAFGQLFGAALYARYEAEGSGFAATYRDLLADTGRMSAVALTAKAGFDIESPDFWRSGLNKFSKQIAEFEAMANTIRIA
jgi:oligoendopeptidase, pepF/M3 family